MVHNFFFYYSLKYVYNLIWKKKLECLFWQNFKLIERFRQPERGSKQNGPDKHSRQIFNPPDIKDCISEKSDTNNLLKNKTCSRNLFFCFATKKSSRIICISWPFYLKKRDFWEILKTKIIFPRFFMFKIKTRKN